MSGQSDSDPPNLLYMASAELYPKHIAKPNFPFVEIRGICSYAFLRLGLPHLISQSGKNIVIQQIRHIPAKNIIANQVPKLFLVSCILIFELRLDLSQLTRNK
jgi:hypothetical protein